MKQIALINLLSEACGHDVLSRGSFARFGAEKFVDQQHAAAIMRELASELEKFESSEEYGVRRWPGIWLNLERETPAELQALYGDMDAEELEQLLAVDFPYDHPCLRLDCRREGEIFCIRVHPTSAEFRANLSTGQMVMSREPDEDGEQQSFLTGLTWVREQILGQLAACLRDPAQYAADIERAVPPHSRVGAILRRDLWEAMPEERHFLKDELSAEQIADFLRIAPGLESTTPDSELTLNKFLRACAICYAGAGYDLGAHDPRRQYEIMADGRHEGLIDIAPDSAAALSSWFASRVGGGHPFEIVRGGNETHIDLFITKEPLGFRLALRGSAISRAAEAIKMALALHHAGVQFELMDAELHANRVQGQDLIGVIPRSDDAFSAHMGFPPEDRIHDTIPFFEIEGFPSTLAKIRWYPLEQLSRID